MVTGRANYRAFTSWMRSFNPNAPDFEAQPDLVDDKEWASWSSRSGSGSWASSRSSAIRTISARCHDEIVNGGYNGYADRGRQLARAKAIFAKAAGDAVAAVQGAPALHRGSKGDEVGNIQEQLKKLGYYHLAIDEDFGGGTEGAVIAFQKASGLRVDGVVGKNTAAAIKAALNGEA